MVLPVVMVPMIPALVVFAKSVAIFTAVKVAAVAAAVQPFASYAVVTHPSIALTVATWLALMNPFATALPEADWKHVASPFDVMFLLACVVAFMSLTFVVYKTVRHRDPNTLLMSFSP